LIIDEIQYAPVLFSYIKISVDSSGKNGEFWLTGSQKFHLMQGLQESLAGRVAILDLLGFSAFELNGEAKKHIPFLPSEKWLLNDSKNSKKAHSIHSLYKAIWQGSFPRLLMNKNNNREIFYRSYIQTYIQRDVKDFYQVSDDLAFYNFLRAVAARTGNLLNYADLARDIGKDAKTARIWLSILERSGLVKLLEPYYRNINKRMLKSPKIYFLDTGLASYLTGWNSPKTLEAGAMTGAMLETYVFIEILKSYWHNGKDIPIYFYRDSENKEIDFLIESDGKLYPIEVKKTATPSLLDIKNFDSLKKTGIETGHGAVLCLRSESIPLSKEVTAMPLPWV
jgi:predicted AAA+ superfamily ATPase